MDAMLSGAGAAGDGLGGVGATGGGQGGGGGEESQLDWWWPIQEEGEDEDPSYFPPSTNTPSGHLPTPNYVFTPSSFADENTITYASAPQRPLSSNAHASGSGSNADFLNQLERSGTSNNEHSNQNPDSEDESSSTTTAAAGGRGGASTSKRPPKRSRKGKEKEDAVVDEAGGDGGGAGSINGEGGGSEMVDEEGGNATSTKNDPPSRRTRRKVQPVSTPGVGREKLTKEEVLERRRARNKATGELKPILVEGGRKGKSRRAFFV